MTKPGFTDDLKRLTILGVIHRDRAGVPLLEGWLTRNRPQAITLEFSPYGRRFREEWGAELKAGVLQTAQDLRNEGKPVDDRAVDSVLDYLDPSVEYAVASAYAGQREIPLFLIDMDRFSRENLAFTDELLSRENLEKLFSTPLYNDSSYQRGLARLFFEKGITVLPYTEEMGERDRYMGEHIGCLMDRLPKARFLHICGWQHLSDPFDIYGFLNPTRAYLYDKALCI
jgi:hypothetical protein